MFLTWSWESWNTFPKAELIYVNEMQKRDLISCSSVRDDGNNQNLKICTCADNILTLLTIHNPN